jgi:hypothetical protein
MSRKAGKTQLELLTKVTKARLTARQAFMANMLGNVRQLLRDLPLDRPLIEHTDEEIIALVRRMFREGSAKSGGGSGSDDGRTEEAERARARAGRVRAGKRVNNSRYRAQRGPRLTREIIVRSPL